MLSVWCLVPGNYPTARRLRPLRSLIEDRTIAEKSIDLILSRYLDGETFDVDPEQRLVISIDLEDPDDDPVDVIVNGLPDNAISPS